MYRNENKNFWKDSCQDVHGSYHDILESSCLFTIMFSLTRSLKISNNKTVAFGKRKRQ